MSAFPFRYRSNAMPARKGQRCRVLYQGNGKGRLQAAGLLVVVVLPDRAKGKHAPKNRLIEFEDGSLFVIDWSGVEPVEVAERRKARKLA